MQRSWQSARITLLSILFFAVTLTFGRTVTLTAPATARTDKSPIKLPEMVPISGWQATGSKAIIDAKPDPPPPARQYYYLKDGTRLEVTLRYFTESNGDVKSMLQFFTSFLKSKSQISLEMRQKPKIGFYGVFIEQQQAHLASCINGQGESTFTESQFRYNRNVNDLLSERPLLWLVGLSELRDRRCLLVHIQLPLQNRSSEQAYQLLEQAWTEWYQWWQSHL